MDRLLSTAVLWSFPVIFFVRYRFRSSVNCENFIVLAEYWVGSDSLLSSAVEKLCWLSLGSWRESDSKDISSLYQGDNRWCCCQSLNSDFRLTVWTRKSSFAFSIEFSSCSKFNDYNKRRAAVSGSLLESRYNWYNSAFVINCLDITDSEI